MGTKKLNISLAVTAGLMLGLSFPPIPIGILAAFAFVPFFILFESIDEYRLAFRYSYITFFVFNLITLYWTGGFVHGKDSYLMIAGGLLLFAHPVFFCVPILGWIFFRRQYGFKLSLLFFPSLWVAYEYLHSLSEIAFPWLTLGNTQTYDLSIIQFASFTGVYGISFWILWLNVVAYVLYARMAAKEWRPLSAQSIVCVIGIFLLYFLPKMYGMIVLNNPPESRTNTIRIGIVQPNIDPFEKWQQ